MKLPALALTAIALSACSQTMQGTVEETTMSPIEALDVASADATCSHGAISETRSFILCEDGALRRSGVETALAQPVDTTLDIETIANRYNRASQDFTGVETATYGSILPQDRKPYVKGASKPTKSTDAETVKIGDAIFDVYTLGSDAETGVIFVERIAAAE